MSYLKTEQEAARKLCEGTDGTIMLVSSYRGDYMGGDLICLVCSHQWTRKQLWDTMRGDNGCPQCSKLRCKLNLLKDEEKYKEELFKAHGDSIKFIGPYRGALKHVKVQCNRCGKIWDAPATALLRERFGCGNCSITLQHVAITKTQTQYEEELFDIYEGYIMCVGDYVNHITNIKHKCMDCGCEFESAPATMLGYRHCPGCGHNISKGEQIVRKWLDSHNIEYVSQKVFDDLIDTSYLRFDFYLPDYNLCIEYDGEQHFRPVIYSNSQDIEYSFYICKMHDHLKNMYCKDNNIKLIRIPYWKISDIDTILSENLLSYL